MPVPHFIHILYHWRLMCVDWPVSDD